MSNEVKDFVTCSNGVPSSSSASAVRDFVTRWQDAEGNEQREANSFWVELLQLLGCAQPTRMLDFERRVQGRRVDVLCEDMGILIENKSRGVNLDERYQRGRTEGGDARMVTPYEQAKWYVDNLPRSIDMHWLIVCNFDEMCIHDLNSENPREDFVSITLDELPEQLHLLSIFTDTKNSRLVKEQKLSVEAGELVGKLYEQLFEQYKNIESDPHEQRSLNVLIVRLVFLLYAEDAGLLHEKNALVNYLREFPVDQMRRAIIDLFAVLDTPISERDPYLPDNLAAFPYVNGGLFGNDGIVVPQFSEQIRLDLLLEASLNFDWSNISPTIFGAAFESTLNPATRRAGGMHYTSPENIHKVIDPLFLGALRSELAEIEGLKTERIRAQKLRAFQQKLASIRVLERISTKLIRLTGVINLGVSRGVLGCRTC